jgi:L-erythro-3,5-diaminohexanoate dehydrogenase
MSSADEQLGNPLGLHRVIAPRSALPQAAERLDNDFECAFDDEILVDVEVLNIDAASFRELSAGAAGDATQVGARIAETVRSRGKQHNRVTGSGGMLIGRVSRVGSAVLGRAAVGDRIATLASLTLTPLRIDAVRAVHMTRAQVDVDGQAVIFASAPFAKLPEDMPERVALAALDVCGAPAQVERHAAPGADVLILGAGGKSGLLCAAAARARVGASGHVVGVESAERAADELSALGLCDSVLRCDGRDALAVQQAALAQNGGRGFDLVVSCVHMEGVEPAAILCARPRGKVLFFAMSTSFSRAALFAEGVGQDVDLYIGNGYVAGHAALTLALLRSQPALAQLFTSRYASE